MAETTSEVEASGKPDFPPFDFTTFAPQLFWLAIIFAFLYVMLEKVALPRVAAVLKAREGKIAGDLDAAERLRKEAEAALAAYEKAIAEARGRAGTIAAETRAALKAETDKAKTQTDMDLAAQVERAEADIAQARARALQAVRAVAVDVSGEVVSKVLGERVPAAALMRAVDDELGSAVAAE